jgi:methyl-accepting chemotaxis protein
MTTEERFEKIETGIRDLIVVSRTVLSSVEGLVGTVSGLAGTVEEMRISMDEMRGSIEDLREAQKRTENNLNALIQVQMETEEKISRLAENVDKLIRRRDPNGPTGLQ